MDISVRNKNKPVARYFTLYSVKRKESYTLLKIWIHLQPNVRITQFLRCNATS